MFSCWLLGNSIWNNWFSGDREVHIHLGRVDLDNWDIREAKAKAKFDGVSNLPLNGYFRQVPHQSSGLFLLPFLFLFRLLLISATFHICIVKLRRCTPILFLPNPIKSMLYRFDRNEWYLSSLIFIHFDSDSFYPFWMSFIRPGFRFYLHSD